MIDEDIFQEFKLRLADRYTAEELCELLNLDVWDIIEAFSEKILELHIEE
jgi:hypothetical protein